MGTEDKGSICGKIPEYGLGRIEMPAQPGKIRDVQVQLTGEVPSDSIDSLQELIHSEEVQGNDSQTTNHRRAQASAAR